VVFEKEEMAEEMRGRQPPQQGRPRPNVVSPFPFGSPLHQGLEQSSFCGSPGQRLLLSTGPPPSQQGEVVTPRLKGREMYGGPVMFGSGSSFRRNRMLSASPYSATLRSRQAERAARSSLSIATAPSSLPSSTASSPSPVPATDSMSSTARLILDTLDKMSTPIQDAKKMPALVQPRAEKRKLIEEELNCSMKSPQRRRVRLGSGALSLAGPPLRKSFAPVSLSNGLSSPLTTSTSKMSSPQPSPAPVAPPAPATALPPTTKSSLKLKSKVVDSGRPPAARRSPPPPLGAAAGLPQPSAISLSTPLPITTLPVFNLAAPTPVMNGVDRAETEESEKATKLTEKEENNNKKNKRPLEEEKAEDTRKKAAIEGGPKSIPSFGGNSDFSPIGGSPKAEKVTSGGSSKLEAAPVNLTFTFRTPTTVISQAPEWGGCIQTPVYRFSLPTPLVIQQEAGSVTNSPLPRAPRTVSTQGDRRLAVAQRNPPTSSPPKMMFSAMPDVTNNLVRKPQCTDKGVAPVQRLPDLGLGPASHLRTGSVMDILGKKS